jgi:hypothetical protein
MTQASQFWIRYDSLSLLIGQAGPMPPETCLSGQVFLQIEPRTGNFEFNSGLQWYTNPTSPPNKWFNLPVRAVDRQDQSPFEGHAQELLGWPEMWSHQWYLSKQLASKEGYRFGKQYMKSYLPNRIASQLPDPHMFSQPSVEGHQRLKTRLKSRLTMMTWRWE